MIQRCNDAVEPREPLEFDQLLGARHKRLAFELIAQSDEVCRNALSESSRQQAVDASVQAQKVRREQTMAGSHVHMEMLAQRLIVQPCRDRPMRKRNLAAALHSERSAACEDTVKRRLVLWNAEQQGLSGNCCTHWTAGNHLHKRDHEVSRGHWNIVTTRTCNKVRTALLISSLPRCTSNAEL
jgi:hypothetical protein